MTRPAAQLSDHPRSVGRLHALVDRQGVSQLGIAVGWTTGPGLTVVEIH